MESVVGARQTSLSIYIYNVYTCSTQCIYKEGFDFRWTKTVEQRDHFNVGKNNMILTVLLKLLIIVFVKKIIDCLNITLLKNLKRKQFIPIKIYII